MNPSQLRYDFVAALIVGFVLFSPLHLGAQPTRLWVAEPGLGTPNTAETVVTDASDNAYVLGSLGKLDSSQSAAFDDLSIEGNGEHMGYLSKLVPGGEFEWVFGYSATERMTPLDAAVDRAGNIVFAG